jgi:hypothetical protein
LTLFDAIIPLVFGLLLVTRTDAFLKQSLDADTRARRRTLLRRIGFVLIGVAALYALIAVAERSP